MGKRKEAVENAKKQPNTTPGGTTTVCPSPATGPSVKSGLGNDVDKEIAKSPKFTNLINGLQKQGWTIKYGDAGKGTYADRDKKTIVVDAQNKGKTAPILQGLAHEGGHARYTPDAYVPPTGLTKEEYVKQNVKRNLKDEGEATLTNAEIREELKKNGGPDIGIAGAQAKKYEEIAKKYPDPKDRDKAREEIGNVFASGEHPSTDPKKTYNDYYSKSYEDHYDKNVAKKK